MAAGSAPGSPFTMQDQLWNKARPELIELFLKPLHALTERYGGKVVLGEISGDDALLRAAEYTNGGGLDIAYSFDLLCLPRHAQGHPRHDRRGWRRPSATAGAAGRSPTTTSAARSPAGAATIRPRPCAGWCRCCWAALRGTVCLYQGEELGLEEATLTFEQLRDPFGITFWPTFAGRDGCRTPMPWEAAAAEAGFTVGEPWLPIPESHRRRAVDVQEADPGSPLNTTRAFLNWRRERLPLTHRQASPSCAPRATILAFERSHNDRILCLFNLGGDACHLPRRHGRRSMPASAARVSSTRAATSTLPP